MDVRNCRACGRLFNHIGGIPICDSCKETLEAKFQEVKEYVRDHPNVQISRVSEEMDVSVKQIKQWIREERLILAEGSSMFIECESCGVPIRMGRYCEECKQKVQSNLKSAYASKIRQPEITKPKTSDRDRMRFLDF